MFPAIFLLKREPARRQRRRGGRKPWLFHNFFHNCGKLRGETLRASQGRECSTAREGAPNPPLKGLAVPSSCVRGPPRIDTARGAPVVFRFLRTLCTYKGSAHEAHFSAQPPPPQEDAWLFDPNGHEKRPSGPEAPSRQGSEAPHRLDVVARARMPPHGFSKAQRVRRRAEFQQVFDTGIRVSSRFFTLLMTRQPGQVARLGIVASRKLGDAVRRNRAKRLIREVFRLNQPLQGGAGVDLVVIPRRELFDAPFTEIDRDFRGAWRRAVSRLPANDVS